MEVTDLLLFLVDCLRCLLDLLVGITRKKQLRTFQASYKVGVWRRQDIYSPFPALGQLDAGASIYYPGPLRMARTGVKGGAIPDVTRLGSPCLPN